MLCHISVCYGLWNYLKGVTQTDNKVENQSVYTNLRRNTLFLRLLCHSLPLTEFMTSLLAESIPKEADITMKEWAEHYRPARQRTARSKTTKDKAGALPPAVYEKAKPGTWSKLSFPDNSGKSSTASVSNESVLLSTTSDCIRLSLLSVTRKLPK